MKCEYQMAHDGVTTGMRTLPLEPLSLPPDTLPDPAKWTAADGRLREPPHLMVAADSTPWGAVVLTLGLAPQTVERALRIGLAQMAQDEAQARAEQAWLATLPKPAFVGKLIADQDWEALYQLQDQGKLHPQYDALIPLRGRSQTVVTLDEPATVNKNTALIEATTVEFSGRTPSLIMAEPEPEPQPQPQLSTPAPTPAPVTKPSAPAKKPSAKSGGATASARSKRSSAVSRSKSSSRPSSRVKSIAG